MRCQICGGPLPINKISKINGVVVCDNCYREYMKRETTSFFGSAFPILDEITSAVLDVDFANKRIVCPKCQSSLRDIESSGRVGCIECYNTFNETILKSILKRQGNSQYQGRKPGEEIEIIYSGSEEADSEKEPSVEMPSKEAPVIEPDAPKAEAKTEEPKADKSVLEAVKASSSWTDLSEEELVAAMKEAVAAEDYQLAAKLRDEIKSRKEEQ